MNEMEASVCSCDDFGTVPAEWFDSRFIRARKAHKCSDCESPIQPGEMYQRIVGKWDGEISTHIQCRVCKQIQSDYGCYIGDLRGQVRELLGTDYVTGEVFDDR